MTIGSEFSEKPILAETPAGLVAQGKDAPGMKFLLFNVSRLCQHKCPFCWTAAAAELIKKQAKPEAIAWMNDEILEAMLARFKEMGGSIAAVMSEGEPLIGINYLFIKRLLSACKKLELGVLLFTNGQELTGEKIGEMRSLNGKTSFSISVNAGSPEAYDRAQGRPGAYEKVMKNVDAWKAYGILASDEGMRRLSIHTVISSESTDGEMQIIQKLVKEKLGNVPWTVTTMGIAGDARLNTHIQPKDSEEVAQLIQEYRTGPTASDPRTKSCCYIVSDRHEGAMYGMTFHPFRNGSIQPCPYLSEFGSASWFSLRKYVEAKIAAGSQPAKEEIASWFDYATLIEAIVTSAAYDIVGYEHCLMRHQNIKEIEMFFASLNMAMAERINGNGPKPSDSQYFQQIVKTVCESAVHVGKFRFGKRIELDVDEIKKAIGFAHLPVGGKFGGMEAVRETKAAAQPQARKMIV